MFGYSDRTTGLPGHESGRWDAFLGAHDSRSSWAARLLSPVTSLAYRWYARRLTAEVLSSPMPEHLAIILDGNRRFARQERLPEVTDGHEHGAQKVSEVVRWCDDISVPVVTLWGLSIDNLKREPEELERIFEIVGQRLAVLERELAKNGGSRRVRVVGRRELLPDDLRGRIEEVERKTASQGPRLLNIAVAYGGRDEILDAVKRMLRTRGSAGESSRDIAEQLSAEDLYPHLYSPDVPEPDLIIRTSGEVRLGGLLLWQSVHSELYFCDVPWPAFRRIDFLRAVRSFQSRKRRYGQ